MSQKVVLIAEDEKPLARALELKLGHEGFAVSIATNGKECLDNLKNSTYDIVLLDLMMPVMDGFQVLEQLKNGIGISVPPIIVLSNLSQPDDENKALSLGAVKYFVKSNTPLASIVDEVKRQLT